MSAPVNLLESKDTLPADTNGYNVFLIEKLYLGAVTRSSGVGAKLCKVVKKPRLVGIELVKVFTGGTIADTVAFGVFKPIEAKIPGEE